MTAARSIHALVLADFARAIRPEVRPKKDALTRELEDLLSRRRQLVEMRVQETLTDRAEIANWVWQARCFSRRTGLPGLLDGSLSRGGEESAGASFLRRDGNGRNAPSIARGCDRDR